MATASATLALHGGRPVRARMLPYGRQDITAADIEQVAEVLRSDWLTTGPKVGEFEAAFAEHTGAAHAVSFSSGTAALHAAAFAAGLGAGDEAITTPLTFCATANCVLYQGACPVFADVRRDLLTLDPEQAAARINPRTRAILPVDYAGHPADLDAFLELAERHRLVVIEDACHALGAQYRGRRLGSLAHMTVFSFHPVKHITTGEGGMVTTQDAELARKLRAFRNHGIETEARERAERGQWYYEMVLLGYNYRLTDIGSVLGLSQLRRLPENLRRRREIAARYTQAFCGLPGAIVPAVADDVEPAWHLYPLRLELERLSAGRDEVFRALRAENIGVNVHYIPVTLHPYYRERLGHRPGEYPIAEDAFQRLLTLPMFAAMTEADVEDVISAVHKVLRHYGR